MNGLLGAFYALISLIIISLATLSVKLTIDVRIARREARYCASRPSSRNNTNRSPERKKAVLRRQNRRNEKFSRGKSNAPSHGDTPDFDRFKDQRRLNVSQTDGRSSRRSPKASPLFVADLNGRSDSVSQKPQYRPFQKNTVYRRTEDGRHFEKIDAEN